MSTAGIVGIALGVLVDLARRHLLATGSLLRRSPALFVVCAHGRTLHAQVLNLPRPIQLHIVFVVSSRLPFCLVAFVEGKGSEEVPGGFGAVAIDIDDGVHRHVL